MSIAPELTKRDRKALLAVPLARCCRTLAVAEVIDPDLRRPAPSFDFDWATKARETRRIIAIADARLTLRGFEHLGYVERRGSWWRRTARGQAILEAQR